MQVLFESRDTAGAQLRDLAMQRVRFVMRRNWRRSRDRKPSRHRASDVEL